MPAAPPADFSALGAAAASEEPPTAEHWESVARRTRTVAEEWRNLHASEEARAEAAQDAASRAAAAIPPAPAPITHTRAMGSA